MPRSKAKIAMPAPVAAPVAPEDVKAIQRLADEIFSSKYYALIHKTPAQVVADMEGDGFVPHGRTDLARVSMALPFDWAMDPFTDSNWKYQVHAWRMLDAYLLTLRQPEGLTRNFSRVVAIMTDWAQFNITGPGAEYTWHDMGTGMRALKLAYIIKTAEIYGLELEITPLWHQMLAEHFAHLTNPAELSGGNHGMFQLTGLKALAWALPAWPDVQAYHDYAEDKMLPLLHSQLGEHGVHTENSPDYHFFGLKTVSVILDSPWWQDTHSPALHDLVRLAKQAQYWFATPAGNCVPVGDSSEKEVLFDFDGLLDWPHSENGRYVGAMLDGYGVVRSLADVPVDQSSYLMVQAGFNHTGHKHSDCLSFVWQENNDYLLIDPGKYSYQKDDVRAYFTSTRAHNAVEIDGKSYSLKRRDIYGSALQDVSPFGKGWSCVAERPHAGLDVRHRRQLLYFPGKVLLVIDEIENLKPALERDYICWWQLNPKHSLQSLDGGGFKVAIGEGGRTFTATVCTSAPDGQGAPITGTGQTEPVLMGWYSPAYLQYLPTTTIGFPVKTADKVTIATLFQIGDGAASGQLALAWRDGQMHVTGPAAKGKKRGKTSYAVSDPDWGKLIKG